MSDILKLLQLYHLTQVSLEARLQHDTLTSVALLRLISVYITEVYPRSAKLTTEKTQNFLVYILSTATPFSKTVHSAVYCTCLLASSSLFE